MILPSFLEYTVDGLERKALSLGNNIEKYKLISQNQSDSISLHLDFVLPEFAKQKLVMKSLSPETVLAVLDQHFSKEKLSLSIHLMGSGSDIFEVYKFFEKYKFKPNWSYLFFVPEKYTFPWEHSDFSDQNENIKIGIWYDEGEWSQADLSLSKNFLLMTVPAGKSGQKLTPEIAGSVLDICKLNPTRNFILDGGWSVEASEIPENTAVVSYSSFWSKFELDVS